MHINHNLKHNKLRWSGMEITMCDKSAPHGVSGCFNFIAHLLQPYADHCIVKPIDSDGLEMDEVNSRGFFNHMIIHDVWCKIITDNEHFKKELKNVHDLKKIYGDNFEKYTTYLDYAGFFGFKIELNDMMMFKISRKQPTSIIYVILQCKCDAIADDDDRSKIDYAKINKDTSLALDLLHKNGYIHGDIRAPNFVSCNGEFKIIDHGYMIHKSNLWLPSWSEIMERLKFNKLESYYDNKARFIFLHKRLPVLTVIVAVGLGSWIFHDLLIHNKKK